MNQGQTTEDAIAHELAHQWIGDSVSLARWQDIWLNEGFATYASWLWFEHSDGPDSLDNLVRDAYSTLVPTSGDPAFAPGAPAPNNLFNLGVYYRGALTLHALRLEIGDEAFFAVLQAYYDRYRDGNVTTENFVAIAEELGGQSLDAFFEAWLYGADLPPIPAMGLTPTP